MTEATKTIGGASHVGGGSKQHTDTPGGIISSVKEQARDFASGAAEIAGNVKDTAVQWASAVGDAAVDAKDKVQQAAATAGKTVMNLPQSGSSLIRQYPLQSLLVVAAIGFVAGLLLRPAARS